MTIDSRLIFIRREGVSFKALTEADVLESNWVGWFNDPEITKYMQQHYFPVSSEKQVEHLRKHVLNDRNALQLGIVPDGVEQIVGIAGLREIDHINRKAELVLIVGDTAHRTFGLFLKCSRAMIEHAFYTLNLRKITAGSLSPEIRELNIRTLGFVEEGVLREEVFKDGQYVDVYRYGLLAREYQQLGKVDIPEEPKG